VGIIKTFAELAHDKLVEARSRALNKYRDAVRPVYVRSPGKVITHIGTCFLLDVDGRKYLITAAHVVDWRDVGTLHVGGSQRTLPIEGDLFCSEAPNGNRDMDHNDYAFYRLPDEWFLNLGSVGWFSSNETSHNRVTLAKRFYTAIGFPNSRNKKVNPNTRRPTPKRAQYSGRFAAAEALYSTLGVTGEDHIAIDWRKQARDEEGSVVDAIRPPGMSGGPLIDLGELGDFRRLSTKEKFAGALAGVLIEHYVEDFQVVVALRINCVIEWIRAFNAS
jgi:hypothetical protein